MDTITPQEKVIAIGIAGALVAKFYFHKDWYFALISGLASIAVHDLLTAQSAKA